MKKVWVVLSVVIAGSALAQYKYTGPDGRTVYTDTPPANAKNLKQIKSNISIVDNTQPLPPKLRELQAQLPVMLYTTRDCDSCTQARNLLQKRGVPYVEKTVNSTEDFSAYKGVNAEAKFPLLTVGREKQLGFDEAKIVLLLDSAGYPTTNELPKTYRFSAGSALSGDENGASVTKKTEVPKAKKVEPKPAAPKPDTAKAETLSQKPIDAKK